MATNGMDILERLEDIAQLYPEGIDEPEYAGRIVWRDASHPEVENFGDVRLTRDGLLLHAAIWTGRWSSEGNPLLAWVEPPFHFADVAALRAWLNPGAPADAPAPAPARAYVDAPPADAGPPAREYIPPPSEV